MIRGWPWDEPPVAMPERLPSGRSWPKVSIVTPSLNQAPFLEATIRSVLLQDYPALEYVVQDGGSADGSVDIVKRYAKQLSFWVSESDAGQADAIQKGWKRSTGTILAYLNSDDLYLPAAIRRVVECFEAHPEVGVVYGACQLIDQAGQPLGRPVRFPKVSFTWLLRYPLTQPAVFFRRGVWERIGGLDTALQYVFDWDMLLRALQMGIRFFRLDGPPLACFRCWSGQKTAGLFEQQIDEQFRVRDRLLAEPSLSPRLVREIKFSRAWAFLWPAYQGYVHGDMSVARAFLRRAVAVDRRMCAHPAFLELYGRTFLGRRVSRTLRRMKTAVWRRETGHG